jgi:hypothetical protein
MRSRARGRSKIEILSIAESSTADTLRMLLARSRPRVSRSWRRRTLFPHGFSATEPLVPPSADGSTPITDALPRSILLDPTAYKPKLNFRGKPPSKDPTVQLSPLEKNLIVNPFGTVPALTMLTVLAKILASKHRTDRTSQSALPRGAPQGNIMAKSRSTHTIWSIH